ncbi:MAG: 2'-5' RNA ligase family protein [Chromatiales bacterium]|nr:2'-5' RNA ligase family protein [Chromatiales bacterium]
MAAPGGLRAGAVATRLAVLLLACLVPLMAPVMAPAQPALPDVVAINVLLDPDATMLDLAAAANARLRARDPTGFALDDGHATHLTVLQAFVARDDLPRIIATTAGVVSRARPVDQELTATGLYYLRWQGRALAGIRVAPTAGLLDLQQQLIAALTPFLVAEGSAAAFVPLPDGRPVGPEIVGYVRDFVPNSSGRNYNPHVTVGLADEAFVAGMVTGPFTPVRFRVSSASIYQLGEFGAAQRKLWTSLPPATR